MMITLLIIYLRVCFFRHVDLSFLIMLTSGRVYNLQLSMISPMHLSIETSDPDPQVKAGDSRNLLLAMPGFNTGG